MKLKEEYKQKLISIKNFIYFMSFIFTIGYILYINNLVTVEAAENGFTILLFNLFSFSFFIV